MKNIFYIVFLSLLILLVFIGIGKKKGRVVEDLIVAINPVGGNSYLVDKEDIVLDLKNVFESNLIGESISDLKLDFVEEVIEKDAFVKDADVFVDDNDVLNVIVQQFEPVARLKTGVKEGYFVASGGLIPLSKHFTPRLMVVSGHIPEDFKSEEFLNLENIVNYISTNEYLRVLIEQLDIDKTGKIDIYPKIGDVKFILNNNSSYSDKLNMIQVYYSNILPENGWGTMKEIDMRYEGQLVVR